MDRVDALRQLLAKVEAGNVERHRSRAFKAIGFSQMSRALQAYNGSLDAAKALHDAVLPDWGYWIELPFCAVFQTNKTASYGGRDENPARAWLIAILEALIAQEEETK